MAEIYQKPKRFSNKFFPVGEWFVRFLKPVRMRNWAAIRRIFPFMAGWRVGWHRIKAIAEEAAEKSRTKKMRLIGPH
ncbi:MULTISPECIES: hypothetical protein [Methylomicrobium]|uniref:hypothetical protein n=1 Tax=Methylomicrobium TaxID=39773 RepID=UPI0002623FE3|nr:MULTISPECIES: hypothetical protein [Methylomicrobium]